VSEEQPTVGNVLRPSAASAAPIEGALAPIGCGPIDRAPIDRAPIDRALIALIALIVERSALAGTARACPRAAARHLPPAHLSQRCPTT
jgi:hypothetical protein